MGAKKIKADSYAMIFQHLFKITDSNMLRTIPPGRVYLLTYLGRELYGLTQHHNIQQRNVNRTYPCLLRQRRKTQALVTTKPRPLYEGQRCLTYFAMKKKGNRPPCSYKSPHTHL